MVVDWRTDMNFSIRFFYSSCFSDHFLLCYALLSVLFVQSIIKADDESFYDLLNIAKDADLVEIRRSFKKLAIKYHPDKNQDDPKAQEKFLRIYRAYEVLKDDELRKKYDTYGEKGLEEGGPRGQHYENWHFYNEQFGIYDDDPEIVTLGASDFEHLVLNGGGQRWFINFYSAHCSHCHHLAPAWREMAKRVQGAFRIGAVNCLDDFMVCNRENIRSYPTLMMYPEKVLYQGRRDTASLIEFVLSQIKAPLNLTPLNAENYKEIFSNSNKPILLMFHDEQDIKTANEKRMLLAANLENLVEIHSIGCTSQTELCKILGNKEASDKIVFYEQTDDLNSGQILDSLDIKEIVNQVLVLLPDFIELDASQFTEIRDTISSGLSDPWLIEFIDKAIDNLKDSKNLEFRKLPQFLEATKCKVGRVNCSKFSELCLKDLKLSSTKFPTFVLFKRTGGFEIYYGRRSAYDVASFVSESIQTNVRSLGPDDAILLSLQQQPMTNTDDQSNPWFLDFFAPWCPPCMKLLPEFRKASKQLRDTVNFGTIDCTVHQSLCSRLNINSYPTTIFYNQSKTHPFLGYHTHTQLIEFVEDMKNPPVYTLTKHNFKQMVQDEGHMWVIDFFNPHCYPCQQLAPEFRKSSKMMKEYEDIVTFGQVDCLQEQTLCEQEYIRAYPTVRLYWANMRGYTDYQQWHRDAYSISQWVFSYMPSTVDEISGQFFLEEILYSYTPYLVDFYTPWCGHCHAFAPEYEKVSKALKNRVNVVKLNCDLNQQACVWAGVGAYPTVKFYKGLSLSMEKVTVDEDRDAAKFKRKQHPFGEELTSQNARFIVSFVEKRLEIVQSSTKTKNEPRTKDEL